MKKKYSYLLTYNIYRNQNFTHINEEKKNKIINKYEKKIMLKRKSDERS